MRCRWQVELNPFCRAVLAHHWPDVRRHDDIRTWPQFDEWIGRHHVREADRVDLIAAGFPCQPVSVAGKRRGKDDERWLWPNVARVLRYLRPRYVLLENVPGLIRMGLDAVLADLADLGFDAEWQVLSAAQFGAPHLRERIWIVAHAPSELHGLQPVAGQQRVRASVAGDDGEEGDVADANDRGQPRSRLHPRSRRGGKGEADAHGDGSSARHANGARLAEREVFAGHDGTQLAPPVGAGWWPAQPPLRRRDDGLPRGLARRQLEALGNSVCVPVVQWLGERIVAHAEGR